MTIKDSVFKHIQELIDSGIDMDTIKAQDVCESFSDANKGTIRMAYYEFKRKVRSDTSTDTSIDASGIANNNENIENEPINVNTSINTSIDTSTDTITGASIHTSMDTSIENFNGNIDKNTMEVLRYMNENFSELKALIERQKDSTSIDTSINASIDISSIVREYTGKESKTFSYNISTALHAAFEKACKQRGLSLRKGIHMALALLVNLA
ncbi:MAG: hypothetical protein HQL03_02310 [Nitrospirae bacterium]|nr:hypothetical protein [Nitrospirota bacterium]